MTRVDEPNDAGNLGTLNAPTQATSYIYDTLNNLITVNQGVQTRSFAYDSLSRLKSANNPESGIISYVYDNNSNLTSKTDARQITTNYVYDNLNRVKNRNYSDNVTPNVAYTYDNLPNAKGKLIKVNSSVSTTEYTSFDILGRVLNHKQRTDNNDYTTSYTYNLSGALIEETYPSGRVVKNTLDQDGDLQQVQSRKSTGTFQNYANAFTYTSAGAVSSLRLGNGKFENTTFNSRLQPIQIGLGASATSQNLLKLNFDYGLANNNGNVKSQQITVQQGNQTPLILNQNYMYDSLNRLKSAEEKDANNAQVWKQTYVFDRYGNRNFDAANTTTLGQNFNANVSNPTVNFADNRFTTGQGYVYDLSGNIIQDAEGRNFVYDAENKQKSVSSASNPNIGTYFFDGNGKRVKKISLTETTIYVYDAGGKLVAEYSTKQADTPKINYTTNDHLGSPRITTDHNGQVISRTDYQPYGEEIASTQRTANLGYTVQDTVKQGFTGYIKDEETGLDFAQARMYKKELVRFTGADPLMASAVITVTQSWNRYSYALNNPLTVTDPSGEIPKLTSEQTRLFDTYVAKQNEGRDAKDQLSAAMVWDKLDNSQQTTFLAATHALENTNLTKDGKALLDKNGKPLNALNLVKSLTAISGELMVKQKDGTFKQDKDGRKQFRLLVELDKSALTTLNASKEFDSSSNSHVYKDGKVLDGEGTYRQQGFDQSIQFSYLKDGTTADIDVDYRSKASLKHYKPTNSDVRFGENLRRHNQVYGNQTPLSIRPSDLK